MEGKGVDEKVDWGKRQKAREADAKRYWPQQLGRLIKRAAVQNREIATLKMVFFFTFHVDE